MRTVSLTGMTISGRGAGAGEADRPWSLVGERPLPLEAGDVDDHRGWSALVSEVDHCSVIERADEQDGDRDGGDDGPEDLERVVAVGLVGQLRVGRAAAEADGDEDQEPFDQDEHDRRDGEGQGVQVVASPRPAS